MKIKDLEISLFTLRIGVFIVMLMWTVDKFVNPQHAAAVFKKFYMIDGLGENLAYTVGALQLVLIIGFVIGFRKRFTYGTILILHGISTFSTWSKFIDPWGSRNLLFFAAIPMLAAIFTLYKLRKHDNFLTIEKEA